MDSTRLGGRSRGDRGRCVVVARDGTTRDALALGMDDHGHMVIAVKVGATVRQETVDASALIMDSERDAEALREARNQKTWSLAQAEGATRIRQQYLAALEKAASELAASPRLPDRASIRRPTPRRRSRA